MNEKKLSVMIVDDERFVLEALRSLLVRHGHAVDAFRNPVEALQALKKGGGYDVVITDVRMPEITGDQFIRTVQKDNPGQHFIVMTGFAEKNDLIRIASAGRVLRILLKPWKNDEILKILEEIQRGMVNGKKQTV